jgi:M6 family metalloprotease-like protein
MRSTPWLAIALVIAWSPHGALAQDVEMLGRHYGTRPPPAYYQELARNPEAFRFTRGRAARMRESAPLLAPGAGGAATSGPLRGLGPPSGPVEGSFRIPVVLGLFSDSGQQPPYSAAQVDLGFFTSSTTPTVTDYYTDVSAGKVSLTGDVFDWVRSTKMTEAQVTLGGSALSCCGIGDFIKDLLARQSGVDWGQYDNDGPDGIPNSGDDDGYVDALAVFQPERGAECDGSKDRVWSHKWALSQASSVKAPYVTQSPANPADSVQYIKVDDYFIQGVLSCSGGVLSPIGTFTHETGHAFGLPDLYDTRSSGASQGDGNWDLMSSGNFGCDDDSPELPCFMGAWSRAALGWVTVETQPPNTDLGTLTLPPVETGNTVYRVDAEDGSGEYFLIENRQGGSLGPSVNFDKNVYASGVLVWQIDPAALAARWAPNTVNSSNHLAVWIRQADGRNDLDTAGTQNRGDAGDPFPGQTVNTEFHAGSNPAARSFQGTATGLTMFSIGPGSGQDMQFELRTSFNSITVSSTGTSPGATGILTVDGVAADPPDNVVRAAPFDPHVLEAAAGESTSQPGERIPFAQWQDGPTSRTRTVETLLRDSTFVAEYGGLQYELHVDLTGGVNGVAPGTIETTPASPDLWFTPNELVQVRAVPTTGFTFIDWTGALAGRNNPDTVTMDAPVQAGAEFQVTYAVSNADVVLEATVAQSLQLSTINGTSPITWTLVSGALPQGLTLSSSGLITGAALDLGTFSLTVQAVDADGLSGTGTVSLDVRAPTIPIAQLASPFLLSGPALDSLQGVFLDRQGNANGAYDLGDLRAWVLANPSLPLTASLGGAPVPRAVRVPVRLGRQGGGR